MLVAAHAVFIARNAAHVLVHAVRLGRTVLVAAVLKADPTPKKEEEQNLHLVVHEHKGAKEGTETQRSEPSWCLTALLVKALHAGEAVPGVICQRHT